jgi:hypothetical protein
MNDIIKLSYFETKLSQKPIEDLLNINFNGSYALLKYIVQKYEIYNSEITKFITENNYGISATSSWRKKGVPPRVWNLVHKDLIMLRCLGRMKEDEVMTLEQLEREFECINQ